LRKLKQTTIKGESTSTVRPTDTKKQTTAIANTSGIRGKAKQTAIPAMTTIIQRIVKRGHPIGIAVTILGEVG
jgi:hypothetical protein